MDLPIAQLPAYSTSIVCSGCKELPRLERSRKCLIPLAVKFKNSSIGNSISSQAQESTMPSSPPIIDSSLISKDNRFINHSSIPERFQTVQEEAKMQTMFEQQQHKRQ
jgi:hypothetical protein